MEEKKGQILMGTSCARKAEVAARELAEAIRAPDTGQVIFFCSPRFDLSALEVAISREFDGIPVVGCTTAGEITPEGYLHGALVGVGLPKGDFTVVTASIGELSTIDLQRGKESAKKLLQELQEKSIETSSDNTFGMLLVDGMSMKEELVASALHQGLGTIPMFGGSAGDGLRFEKTYVYCDGAFHTDAAVLLLVHTFRPIKIFKTEHFIGAEDSFVVTEADPEQRIVYEIDGYPAVERYAEIAGCAVDELGPQMFASHPVLVRVGGHVYVRSVQRVLENGALQFYCAIEEGIVLKRARKVDMLANLQERFSMLREEMGAPELVLGCDCILRNLEAGRSGEKEAIGRLLADNRVIGFSTYGEQLNGMHINQTFTGMAIGRSLSEKADDKKQSC